MFRILLSLALSIASAPCLAAGVWNGSTSSLSVTQSAAAPDYPVLMAAWVVPSNVTASHTVLSIDNNDGGSADALALVLAGTTGGDPVRAEAVVGGSAATASAASGFTASGSNNWQLVVAYFESATARRALRSTGGESVSWGAENTTSRTLGNVTHIRVGGGWGGTLDGQIAHAAVWYGVDDNLVDVAVQQLSCGLKPHSERSIIRDSLAYYQPLVSAANENNSATGNVLVGSSMTATNLTFNGHEAGARNSVGLLTFPTSSDIDRRFPRRLFFRWPPTGAAAGPLPDFRMVKIVDGVLQLAGASDANSIGATEPFDDQWEEPFERERLYNEALQPVARFNEAYIRVEVVAANTIDAGDIAYQGADGKAASSGTVRIGVAYEDGTGGEVIKIIPSP